MIKDGLCLGHLSNHCIIWIISHISLKMMIFDFHFSVCDFGILLSILNELHAFLNYMFYFETNCDVGYERSYPRPHASPPATSTINQHSRCYRALNEFFSDQQAAALKLTLLLSQKPTLTMYNWQPSLHSCICSWWTVSLDTLLRDTTTSALWVCGMVGTWCHGFLGPKLSAIKITCQAACVAMLVLLGRT